MSETPTAASPPPAAPARSGGAGGAKFPPYPPYAVKAVRPTVADTIIAGHTIRRQHKSGVKKPARPPPRPAKARYPKATDVKLPRRSMKAQTRCLKRHGTVLTDRLERIAKPSRRTVIYLWREYANTLPPETIARLRSMLDADEPFKPDQAYEYFINLRRTRKKTTATQQVNAIKKDILAMCYDKRFLWARNATVTFAKGIQQRLSRPGRFALADGMLRLSNIILDDMCGYMRIRTPSRRSKSNKSKFMMEMADKIAVWIDEILSESDDRMLMMDFDEDDDITYCSKFQDDFLDMMGDGGGGGGGGRNLLAPDPAYMKFKGKMLDAFLLLTDTMYARGAEQLLQHGKFTQTYAEGANELKRTISFNAPDMISTLAEKLRESLKECSKAQTTPDLEPYMKEVIEICSKYLSQYAEHNKDKGPAFRLLVKTMRTRKGDELFQKDKIKRTYGEAATNLENAKGLETDHDDEALTETIHAELDGLMSGVTPADLEADMKETIDVCSKYLSQETIDELERGPAFDLLIHELEKTGGNHFSDFRVVTTNFKAAYTLKSAPGLTGIVPDPTTAPTFAEALHRVGDGIAPVNLKEDMNGVIDRCANYLSAFVRDRDIAMGNLLKMMKSKPRNAVSVRDNYTMNYSTGAEDTENSPSLIPYLPIKDIADEGKANLTKDMHGLTPPELLIATKALIKDVGRHLSQPFALRSGIAGDRYPLEFLSAVKTSLGERPLFKYKAFGQTYTDAADTLMHSGPLQVNASGEAEDLKHMIKSEWKRGVPEQLAPSVMTDLHPTMEDASAHLANVGVDKGDTLEHLVVMMKDKGDTHLAELQGYDQTYEDAAKRIEISPTLTNETVEKDKYTEVKGKLTTMADEKIDAIPEKHAELMPEVISESSKFLAKPIPETAAEKRGVLADIIAKGGEKILGEEGIYKLTHIEGGEEVKAAPVGVTTAHDEKKKQVMIENVRAVMPSKKMEEILKEPTEEGAAHLVDTLKGRGEAMAVIHKDVDAQQDKDFLTVGEFSKTHSEAATMLTEAPHFGGQKPFPALQTVVEKRVQEAVKEELPSHINEKHMTEAKAITSKYIAGVATAECGLDMKTLGDLEGSGKLGRQKIGETDEERRRRLARDRGRQGDTGDTEESAAALAILHKALQGRGTEIFYEQPHLGLSHVQASTWLKELPIKVEKSVKESGDTARLHKKFEKKLSTLVTPVTPPEMYDSMQDVVIESARQLAEQFVAASYEAQSRSVIIGEMQKRGNEIISEIDDATETSFFAAQRLKKAKDLKTNELCTEEAPKLQKKLDEIMRHCTMQRKLGPTVKDLSKDAANYLSTHVTKPDAEIEAYVALLEAMEEAGDATLVEGTIPKKNKEGAQYLRGLTSLEDKINRQNNVLQNAIQGKMKAVTADVESPGFTKAVMDGVIKRNAALLTSYIQLQEEKTKALNILVEKMDEAGNRILLRHGNVRKGHKDGADLLRGKTADQLSVPSADPVVARKIEIKLITLMHDNTPPIFENIMKDVIKDVTSYLALHLLEPQIIKICKCMKNVFVQCELWCEEILRRVAKPPCTCSRHVSVQDIQELSCLKHLRICPGSTREIEPGVELSITECRARYGKHHSCQALQPTIDCRGKVTTAYLIHSTSVNQGDDIENDYPTRIPRETQVTPASSESDHRSQTSSKTESERSSTVKSLLQEIHSQNMQFMRKHEQTLCLETTKDTQETVPSLRSPVGIYGTTIASGNQLPPSMYSRIFPRNDTSRSSLGSISESMSSRSNMSLSKSDERTSISSDKMADWHAMMVSLIWNVQAWRKWIQENIDRGSAYQYDPNDPEEEPEKSSWNSFQRRVSTEALQWRQYNIFSRQLIMRLISRYRDKEILSPNRAVVRTERYQECASEMLDIISMFNNWTQFLILVIRETGSLQDATSSSIPLHAMRWNHYKQKVIKYSHDWIKYNLHLKECWEKKYESFISECIPYISDLRPVWVVGACGAVPSGAVAAGIYDGEVIWIARTTHRSNVLPAALHPSKHCCSVYCGGAVHYYTKYQVMCNAEVNWVAWRGGEVGAHAVRVAEGVYIGRVHYRGSHLIGPVHAPQYRCHVVIFGRPFAFNCYDLLILAKQPEY